METYFLPALSHLPAQAGETCGKLFQEAKKGLQQAWGHLVSAF